MRCLVISVCQWHGDREKNQLFSPGAYPRMGHIRKCFLSPAIPQGLWLKTHIQETSRWRRSTKLIHPLQKKISLVLESFYFASEAKYTDFWGINSYKTLLVILHKYKFLTSDANNVFAKIGYSWNHTRHERMISIAIIYINPINY